MSTSLFRFPHKLLLARSRPPTAMFRSTSTRAVRSKIQTAVALESGSMVNRAVYMQLSGMARVSKFVRPPVVIVDHAGAQTLTYLHLWHVKGSSLVVSSPKISPTRLLIRLAGQRRKPSSRRLPAQLTSSSRITYLLSTLLSVVTLVMRHTALRDALAPVLNKLRIRPILTVFF